MPRRSDSGSAVVEFVLVSVLLVFLVLAIVQVGIVMHLRNVAQAAVTDAARYAANADRDCVDGRARAGELLSSSIARLEIEQVSCRPGAADGAPVVVVRATVRLPLLVLPIAPADVRLTLSARAVEEGG